MRQAFLLFIAFALALVPSAGAQDAAANAAPQVVSVRVSEQKGEVRVEIATTGPVAASPSLLSSTENLMIDLPGVVYPVSAHRYRVNQAGIRDVRIWQQQQQPPITRISIELARDSRFLISQDGSGLVLRLGPSVPGQPLSAVGRGTKRETPPPSSGRPSGPARAIGGMADVFRRSKQPSYGQEQPPTPAESESAPAAAQNTAPSVELPALAPAASPAEARAQSTQTVPPPTAATAANSTSSSEPAPAAAAPVEANAEPVKPAEPAPIPAPAPAEIKLAPTQIAAAAPPPAAEPAPALAPESVVAEAKSLVIEPVAGSAANASSPTANEIAPPLVWALETPSAEATASAHESPAASPVVGGQAVNSEQVGAAAQAFVEVPNADLRTLFHVKFVQQDSAYIDGGRSAGLSEGMKLVVKDAPAKPGTDGSAAGSDHDVIQAELVVVGVAETSAVTEIRTPKRDVVPGDLAYLSAEDTQALVQQHALGTTRKYPAVISFTEGGDALDQEAHAEVPRPPMPSVNHARGRIGFDYMGTMSTDGTQFSSRDVGLMVQADFTRIGGTYWNLNGYWRGQLNSASSAGQFQTLQELINRTYHIGMTYDNPNSHWVGGFGRMYLPWASSLDTIDGGYFGRRVRKGFIAGIFAGTTPDPTSWNYNPHLQMGGTFANFEGGNFDRFHYSSTSGAGVNLISWQMNRPFVFFENSISYRRHFSIYHSLQADSPAGNAAVAAPGAGIGRSFLTVRWSPFSRLQLDGNHTYFRDVPTFDATLVGTGLLDKYLFQGFSGGAHVDAVKQISVYTEIGRSSRTGDAQSSLNEMYGVTFGRVPLLDLRADAHYSRFNSSFGAGTYEAVTLSRNFNERIRLDVLAGNQVFTSTLAGNQSARFLTTTVDSTLGSMFFVQGSFTFYRGDLQSYNQWLTTFGYRFDTKRRR